MSSPLTFARCRGGRFQIGLSPLETIQRYVQNDPVRHEFGGVLLGRHIIATCDIIVDHVTTPLPGDRHSRFHFFRARRRHQEAIDDAWRQSGGTRTYLGEWHTHPETVPVPSLVDRLEWQRKLMFDEFSDAIFFVIVGTETLCVWEGSRAGLSLRAVPLMKEYVTH